MLFAVIALSVVLTAVFKVHPFLSLLLGALMKQLGSSLSPVLLLEPF